MVRRTALRQQGDRTGAAHEGGACHPLTKSERRDGDDHRRCRARPVTGGVDTHLDLNVAAALDPLGGLLGVAEFPTTARATANYSPGWRALARWPGSGWRAPAPMGPAWPGYLRASGVEVVEVDRPNRQARRRTGKSDPADAIEAARAALSGRAQGAGKTRDGNVEAIRALVVAKRSARSTKIKTLNQIRHLGFTAPEELREHA